MSNSADQVIDALHAVHDELVDSIHDLTYDQLMGPSAATEWTVADVLSHLGSGAVITRAGLDAALAGEPDPGMDANKAVWARWDAMTPQEQQAGFFAADAELLAAYDALDDATRESLRIDLGFLPAPVDVATAARFRLNEAALHAWDVRSALEQDSVVHPVAVPLLLDQAALMLGWIAKPGVATQWSGGRPVELAVRLSDTDRDFGLRLGEQAELVDAATDPDASLELPAEAWLRLVTGRLGTAHTPSTVEISGDLPLDELRRVFPGF